MKTKPRKYADGGKVLKSDYGTPTYPRAVLARVGVGDGYGNPKKQKDPPAPAKKVADPSIGAAESAIRKRHDMLQGYADGGKVKRKKGC